MKYVDPTKLITSLIPAMLDPENLLIKGNQKEPLTGLSYKEALGIFILAESMNYAFAIKGNIAKFSILPASYQDPNNEDGAIFIELPDTNEGMVTYLEQVSVTPHQKSDITDEILKQVKKKHEHYSSDYFQTHSLLIFTDKIGAIDVKAIKDFLRVDFKFGFYAIFCLEEAKNGVYRYAIISLDPTLDHYGKFYVYVDTQTKRYEITDREKV